jgi:hypothetical protein
VFTDAATGFSTTDVRDAQDQVVQFTSDGVLVWTPGNIGLPGYPGQGLTVIADAVCRCWFEVRFGTKDGERRAYLTADYGHDNPGSIVDLEVVGGALVVTRTQVFPPGTFTLFGVVTEAPAGVVGVEGVLIQRGYETGWLSAVTDSHGFYEIRGLYTRTDEIHASKHGYEAVKQTLAIDGDTRLDFQLVRR